MRTKKQQWEIVLGVIIAILRVKRCILKEREFTVLHPTRMMDSLSTRMNGLKKHVSLNLVTMIVYFCPPQVEQQRNKRVRMEGLERLQPLHTRRWLMISLHATSVEHLNNIL